MERLVTRFLLWVLFFPPFLFVLLYNSSAYNKSPFNNYTWCCIATAGNRATIPLEIVVPHKRGCSLIRACSLIRSNTVNVYQLKTHFQAPDAHVQLLFVDDNISNSYSVSTK